MNSKFTDLDSPVKNTLSLYLTILVVECCEIWVKFLLWRVWVYLGSKDMGHLSMCCKNSKTNPKKI